MPPRQVYVLATLLRGVLMVVACAVVWTVLDQRRSENALARTQDAAGFVLDMMVGDLESRVAEVGRMARSLSGIVGLDPLRFQSDGTAYIEAHPGILALSYADRDHVLRQVVPQHPTPAMGRNLAAADPVRGAAFAAVRASRAATMTAPMELIGGGTGVLLLLPLSEGASFGGTLNVVIRLEPWIDHLLASNGAYSLTERFAFSVQIAEAPARATETWAVAAAAHETSATANFLGHRISVAARPIAVTDILSGTSLPEVVTVALSLLLTALSALDRSLRAARGAQSQLREALDEASDLNLRLKQEVEVRRAAEAEALEAAELKSRFMANMSHEIRTPVNAIMGMFELIQMADIPERQKRQAEVGREAAQRLFNQLNNVLELSQIEAKAVRIDPQEINIRDLAQHWAVALEALIRKANRTLESRVEVAPDVREHLIVDVNRLNQILTNLLDNAVKYTTEGEVLIRLTAEETGAGASEAGVIIEVMDTGPGISGAEREKIFERYHRSDFARSQYEGGMGLGLNIVQDLVALMQLKLELGDTPGGGTTFRIHVPAQVCSKGSAVGQAA